MACGMVACSYRLPATGSSTVDNGMTEQWCKMVAYRE